MRIKVIDVEIEAVQKGKNTYQKAEIFYDTNGNKQSFKVIDFASPAVYKIISKATKGDMFDVEVTKNDAGFNQWVSCVSTDGTDSDSTSSSTTSSKSASSTNAPAARTSTYETAAERATRQRLIVRQSSLTAALGILSPGSKGPLDVQVVKALAEELTDWVFEKTDLFDEPNDIEE
jgi:hypothetical protein